MAKQQFSDLDFQNVARVLNLPNALTDQEPVTLAQLSSTQAGIAWKDNVRTAALTNITIASPGSTISGVDLSTGINKRVLLLAQTSSAENGIYLWSGASTPLVRTSDANTADALTNAVVSVDEGTDVAGNTYRQQSVNFVLDTDPVVFGSFGSTPPPASESTPGIIAIASQVKTDLGINDTEAVTPLKLVTSPHAHKGMTANIGDGSTTTFTVTHNFNTRNVNATVYRNGGNYDEIEVEVRHNLNSVVVVFAAGLAPTLNQYTVCVSKVV